MTPPDRHAITRVLTDHLTGRPAWDEPPSLLAIARDPSPPRCRLVPVEASGLEGRHPADAVEALARAATPASGLDRVPCARSRMWGLALRWEAFATPRVTASGDAPAPGRVEVRVTTACDTAGRRYLLQQGRDTGEVEELFTVTGRTPAALEHLLSALPQ
ncbi:hypothetical protein [Streptomonospora salina]|uniref:Uncharacterized protein n=1 Tax=Streptomonospora salina TaxID=104205 RepID=A0A841EAU3_9ACTN|nr:hypothetical protein [Streptomonospora salina]MBB6000122.1 hypothetical protein [Streptomonospora salina]